ncbi:MAG: glycosyltransferase family 2 protein [FCB group bacterium]|nr:glycosyltransferase family 2 protein [FCB group bacterium]MBL7027685.1 glycosyltransferase family 2 protein [Candidatus Neomarinimicrobiota bacterium]MBL7121068.1 glycosyltransferase family 2 protein [Candidatus Neomarinimicrobiota bacterium]
MIESHVETLALVIPVYNEAEVISDVINAWNTCLDGLGIIYTIHVYDDGSTDTTLEILKELSREIDPLDIHTSENQGHGPTLLKGYNHSHSETWIFQTDADDEMSPEFFNKLWSHREEYDFLLGRRSQRTQPLPRKLISLISRCVVHLFYGRGVWDVNSPFRLMRTSVLSPIIAKIPINTFAPNLIISGMVNLKKVTYFETLIPHHERQTGNVSIRKFRLFMAALKSFWQTIHFRLSSN